MSRSRDARAPQCILQTSGARYERFLQKQYLLVEPMDIRRSELSKKSVLLVIMLLLANTLTLAFNILRVEGAGVIYIRADGSIDPPTAPIAGFDNMTYTLTANCNDSIVIYRDNCVFDGAGFTLEGANEEWSTGIELPGRSNVTVINTTIKAFYYGIYVGDDSSNVTIAQNNLTANSMYGILLYSSDYHSVFGNNITANGTWGIYATACSFLIISENNIVANSVGLALICWNNTIVHNNFINNTRQAVPVYSTDMPDENTWDNGYPSGGNYWSNYNGTDQFGGPYQNETGCDGIIDTSYTVPHMFTDRYPLMLPFVYLAGDLKHDHKVDILDAVLAAASFGSTPSDLKWNPEADINHDNMVNIFDLILLARNFGKTV